MSTSNVYPARAERLLLAPGAPTVQWGGGRLFDGSTGFFFRKIALTLERKVGKLFLSWKMNGLSKGYQKWGRMAKIGFFGQKPRFCFSVMWVTKLLISSVEIGIFCPRTNKFGIFVNFGPGLAGSFGNLLRWWVGW